MTEITLAGQVKAVEREIAMLDAVLGILGRIGGAKPLSQESGGANG